MMCVCDLREKLVRINTFVFIQQQMLLVKLFFLNTNMERRLSDMLDVWIH